MDGYNIKMDMKKIFNFIFLIFLLHKNVYASGRVELPDKYIDLGTINILEKSLRLNLPYIKPNGIIKIITSPIHGLIIDQIIIDGRIKNVKKQFLDLGAYEHISHVYEEDVNSEENEYFFEMSWGRRENNLSYSYFSRNGKIHYSPDYYEIPYGSNEIFIKYRVRLVGNEITDFRNYFVSEELYIVKFNLLWE
jgi:hypothetical protein